MFFSGIEVLLHHRDVPFQGIVYGTDGLVEQVREPYEVQHLFGLFKIPGFKVSLYQPKRTEEKVCEQHDHGGQIEDKCGPKTTEHINQHGYGQNHQTDPESISDKRIKPFHGAKIRQLVEAWLLAEIFILNFGPHVFEESLALQ
jgi:hypothetical protein